MMTPILDSIVKEAALGGVFRGIKGVSGKALNVLFGTMAGAYTLDRVAELADKGPIGIESEARWQADLARRHAATTSPRILAKAQRKVRKGGLLGSIAGAALAVPFAFKKGKRNFILPLAGALIGRSLGRKVQEKKYPQAVPRASQLDETLGRYAALFTPEDRAQWIALRNSPEVQGDPQLQMQLNQAIQARVEKHPEYKKYMFKKKTFNTLGKILGGGAVLATMIYGKKKKLGQNVIKGILGKPGGFMSSSPFKAFTGMGLAGAGLGVAGAYTGARRAGLTPQETTAAIGRRALGQEMGMDLGFYGSAFRKMPKVV